MIPCPFNLPTDIYTDNAIFVGKLNANLGSKIAAAVLPLGLPESSLPDFITALNNQNTAALGKIPGVTGQIIGAGVGGLREAYTLGFRFIWVAGACFTVAAVVGTSTFSVLLFFGITRLINSQLVSSSLTLSRSSTTASITQPRRRKSSMGAPPPHRLLRISPSPCICLSRLLTKKPSKQKKYDTKMPQGHASKWWRGGPFFLLVVVPHAFFTFSYV